MSSTSNSRIRLQLDISSQHPELLKGLDAWLRLGLLTDAQVQRLSRQYLACSLPQRQNVLETNAASALSTVTSISLPARPTPVVKQVNLLTRILQSLRAELSVMWLLVLGVFMVVMSSGVLAASQWERFPPAGQYLVLLTYTLSFWGAFFWAGRQGNLRLTVQTLQIVTLLLVPVNFWAMDSFGLWKQPPWLWLVVAIAALTLTAMTYLLFSQRQGKVFSPLTFNFLGLSYLHWGWEMSKFPLVAIYLGLVGTVVLWQRVAVEGRGNGGAGEQGSGSGKPLSTKATALVACAIAILLVRAIFIARVDLAQLGLALGICGYLLEWLSPPHPLSWISGGLLLLGWIVSVESVPWQALAVSGLGLWFCLSRLQRFWRRADLALLLGIGLQAIWLGWRLIPETTHGTAIAVLTQLTNSQSTPWALLSLVLFPYVVFIVWLASWLYRRQQLSLAQFGEAIALCLGCVLTCISLINPLLRSLNLLFSTVTLGLVSQRHSVVRRNTQQVVYLTHITGLLTIVSAIDYLLPNLNLVSWAVILLTLMVGEWVFSLLGRGEQSETTRNEPIWQRSAWHIGLVLAGLSYSLLASATDTHPVGVLQWLVAPFALTGVASRTHLQRRQLASWLSVTALGMAQLLTLDVPGVRLVGLGIAAVLMLVNTYYVQHLAAAGITVGFALSFLGCLLWEVIPELSQRLVPGWLLVGAIVVSSLWLIGSWWRHSARTATEVPRLAQIYAQAVDGWAIALCSLELVWLTIHSVALYWAIFAPSVTVSIATFLTLGGIAVRIWSQFYPTPNTYPPNLAFYALGWSLELLTAELLGFTSAIAMTPIVNLAIANIVLGLMTQVLGDWWQRRTDTVTVPNSWHILPLLYGVLGAVLSWSSFTSQTGLSSLAVALIAIGVGRRRAEFKPLVYLGIIGITLSAYELLYNQISHLPLGDQLVAIAALGTSIMFAYRVLSPWLNYFRLNREELKGVAHVHWAIGSSCLLLAALNRPIVSTWVGIGTGLSLTCYAIWQGRHNPSHQKGTRWVYLGFLEAASLGIYILNTPLGRILAEPFVPFGGAIACVVVYPVYLLPWEAWGWRALPWQQVAIVLPLVTIGLTAAATDLSSLLVAAGFYVLLARHQRQIRLTYLSVLLIDWAIARELTSLQLTSPLASTTLLGLSLLYIAQIDLLFQQPEHRSTRHYLRLVGTGAICGMALWTHQQTGIVPGILSIVAIFAGLALRIRAFLYVGTATFLLNAFYQLAILISLYSFLKWVIGLLVGIAFIWIAATFETRRDQMGTLLRNWIVQFEDWQ